ncbi:cupin domain-containing protein [Streptomyces sp. S186]|uniref:cupin domain-containing protein n=1 Tax=Streptomyces sp. S186 TaxID=3434395 RepID=UPI003F66DE8F
MKADAPHTGGADTPDSSDTPGSSDTSGGAAPASGPVPVLLCDARKVAADPPVPSGVLWRLAESGRQLDANVVRLPPEGRIDTHVEPDLDVLLYVVSGEGAVDAEDGRQPLAEGGLLWLPRGSRRSVTAGRDGLAYLTVHLRRPGLRIKGRPGS